MDELKKFFLTLLFFLVMAAVLIVLYGMQINKPQANLQNSLEIKPAISVDKLLPPAPADGGNASQSNSAQPTVEPATPSSHLSSKDSDFNTVNANSENGAPAFETLPMGQSDMQVGQYTSDTDSKDSTQTQEESEQVYEQTHNFSSSSTKSGSMGVDTLSGLIPPSNFIQNYAQADNIRADHVPILYQAKQTGSAAAKAVLRQARVMALDDREIIQGACWDYLNAVFKRAGVNRDTVFKGAYPDGPFIATADIQAGDWLYYVNHSYHDIEHSGMFVGWVDKTQNQALILSYAGEHRKQPARYRVYDISHTYNVMRPSI